MGQPHQVSQLVSHDGLRLARADGVDHPLDLVWLQSDLAGDECRLAVGSLHALASGFTDDVDAKSGISRAVARAISTGGQRRPYR